VVLRRRSPGGSSVGRWDAGGLWAAAVFLGGRAAGAGVIGIALSLCAIYGMRYTTGRVKAEQDAIDPALR
jgi:hypothetical protein